MSDINNNETVRQDEPSKQEHLVQAPALSLPKGGGAIRGVGEKFAANPVTGTGSLTVPIFTSPGRSGFGPQLSLSYDSGAGNGPFGFGWNLSLPSITRKTDKGLPRYADAGDSDEFILSGAEDLVPILKKDVNSWHREDLDPRTVNQETYCIECFRPRIEGLFARIERWTNASEPSDVFWRSISKDNITTWYGKTTESRIADPADDTRIFSWLICQSYDDKGNVIVYRYSEENPENVDLTQAHERNRGNSTENLRAANRYLKRIRYGNRVPYLPQLLEGQDWPTPPDKSDDASRDWLFEVVFDYDEGHYEELPLNPELPDNAQYRYVNASSVPTSRHPWPVRPDPFSSYRAGFEVRTYRLCQRVLMFHHFAEEPGVGADCLVRSTDFTYRYELQSDDTRNPIHTFLMSVSQSGYIRKDGELYMAKAMPPLEFEYSQAIVKDQVQEINPKSLENLPYGLDGASYQWVDLDGEGVYGILTEQAGCWFYKPNLSPVNIRTENGTETIEARFGPNQQLAEKPSLAAISSGGQQLLDLAGDGQLDLVELEDPIAGFYERTPDEGWESFRPFEFHPNLDWGDPNLKFVDLTGDGHADILVTEDEVLTWYASLAESGFAPAQKVRKVLHEEQGPRLVFADRTQSIYLADLSGDGLTDLVRIRNGEVCYWPNLGYCNFGAKVSMDNAPWFDAPDLFDQRRIRLADIDGSGSSDIIYLAGDGVHLYFNQSGNRWSEPNRLKNFPRIDNLAAVTVADLLGNGTACLVWSSPLPGNAQQPMRYIDLMGGQKPHLLIKTVNNLGAETHVHYAPSTRFYLEDKLAGTPWITKIPFPVYVVERVETYDHVSRNRFVTRYAYHHGYYDGIEREFRGFGMVEQMDTEMFTALEAANNIDRASHMPPVLTRTWFHTGAWLEGGTISRQYEQEYYREGEAGLDEVRQRALLLDDTLLPHSVRRPAGVEEPFSFSADEAREAVRSLKGAILRQEIYALDGTEEQDRPYSVSERNYTIACLQPKEQNPHAVFFTHARETIDFHYERKLFPVVDGVNVDAGTAAVTPDVQWLADPRVTHAFTLAVDEWGNVKQAVAAGYGRRFDDPALSPEDRAKQQQILITYTENQYAHYVNEDGGQPQDFHRAPPPYEARTFEVFNFGPSRELPAGITKLFGFAELDALINDAEFTSGAWDIPYYDVNHAQAIHPHPYRRLIEQVRSLYRSNDLSGPCPLGEFDTLALLYESYKLAFTQELLTQVYQRRQADGSMEILLPDPAAILGGTGSAGGGYVDLDGNQHWWIPLGRMYFSVEADPSDPARIEQEQEEAQAHFYLPKKFTDPFGNSSLVVYDNYDLLTAETKDALENIVSTVNNYRVLQPGKITDPNGNRSEAVFDALGLVAGTAVMGKEREPDGIAKGDSLDGFVADFLQQEINNFFDADDPHEYAAGLLGNASTRIIYDLDRFRQSREQNPDDPAKWQPAFAATLARETHMRDPLPKDGLKIHIGFSYSDGFGREIQKKIQAEPEQQGSPLRWIGSGWTIFNNKGKPVRQYEPFFSPLPEQRHRFEFGVQVGVSPILFYDPVSRVVATLHPNHTYEKVVFDPWQQKTWDVNDTVLADPRTDEDINGFVGGYFAEQPADWQTWYQQRSEGQLGEREKDAALKSAIHAETPPIAYHDSLGRAYLTIAHNRYEREGAITDETYPTRVQLDIEGNQREIIDAKGRIVMRYDYDLLGNRIHQASMEAGERWMLNDIKGKPIRSWDSRGHTFRTEYDALRRPVRQFVLGTNPAESDPQTLGDEICHGQVIYGEDFVDRTEAMAKNLLGRAWQQYDGAGLVTNEVYDFKGNLLRGSRRLVNNYKSAPDWNEFPSPDANPEQWQPEIFQSSTRYDALNRPIQLIAPHAGIETDIIQHRYNEANLLEGVDVWLKQPGEPGDLLDPMTASGHGVQSIHYNAKGQRMQISYGNGNCARTGYEYDPQTFRLTRLLTIRGNQDSANCAPLLEPRTCEDPPLLCSRLQSSRCIVQDLSYTYDPAGNITHIRDDAQQIIYFRNKRVEPSNAYTYDAVYRLIEATGREHLGQAGGAPIPHSYNDAPRVGIKWSDNDGTVMGTYIERYVYDAVGNFDEMKHIGLDSANAGWTRVYSYDEDSQLGSGKSNRLSSTTLNANGNNKVPEPYLHDAHGNMVRMPHLGSGLPGPNMHWDYRDQLRQTDLGGGGTAYYVYDASGQRIRKVWEKAPGLIEERIYLGGFEIFRKHDSAIGADTATLERETLHIMDDQQRIALVETRTFDKAGNDPAPAQLIRYQLGNHLGSSSLELDEWAQIISYEEYTPYGSTSYQAVRSQTETAKRYRYTGKERDEESGLYYHGARYYAAWLGRWVSCDPKRLKDGISLYLYTQNKPVQCVDKNGTGSGIADVNNTDVINQYWQDNPNLVCDEARLSCVYTDPSTGDTWISENGKWVSRNPPGEIIIEAENQSKEVYRWKMDEIAMELDKLRQDISVWKEVKSIFRYKLTKMKAMTYQEAAELFEHLRWPKGAKSIAKPESQGGYRDEEYFENKPKEIKESIDIHERVHDFHEANPKEIISERKLFWILPIYIWVEPEMEEEYYLSTQMPSSEQEESDPRQTILLIYTELSAHRKQYEYLAEKWLELEKQYEQLKPLWEMIQVLAR